MALSEKSVAEYEKSARKRKQWRQRKCYTEKQEEKLTERKRTRTNGQRPVTNLIIAHDPQIN